MPQRQQPVTNPRLVKLIELETSGRIRPEHRSELESYRARGLAPKGAAGTEAENKSTGFFARARGANTDFLATESATEPRSPLAQTAADVLPQNFVNSWTSPDRQKSIQAKEDFVRASLRYESGAAIGRDEFEAQDRIFFPQPGDSPELITQKEASRLRVIESLQVSAGAGASRLAPQAPEGAPDAPRGPPPGYELKFGDQIGDEVRAPFKVTSEQTAAVKAFYATHPKATSDQIANFGSMIGLNISNAEQLAETLRRGGTIGEGVNVDDAAYKESLRQKNEAAGVGENNDLQRLAENGLVLNLADEGAGVAGGVKSLLSGESPIDGYVGARDQARVGLEDARERTGWAGTAAEIGGSLLLPTGAARAALSAATTGGRFMAGARAVAPVSALSAFGAGEGMESVPNALIGYGAGGAVGGALSVAAPVAASALGRVVNTPGRTSALAARAAEMNTARDAATAAQAEGITVSRGVLDPLVRNRVTALETTPGGAAAIQRGLSATRDDLEAGTGLLGRGGAGDRVIAGDRVQDAGKRYIATSGTRANSNYNRAKALAGFTTRNVKPDEALAAVDGHIAELRANGEQSNAALINYLSGVKGDLMRPGGLSIDAVRAMRTNMRGQINTANLTRTDAERRMTGVIEGASRDIERTLGSANNQAALKAYKDADSFYRERMTHIDTVLKPFLGSRDNPLPADQVASKLAAMAKPGGDHRRLALMMRSLDPDEAREVASTFAAGLGRSADGKFSPALLTNQAAQISPRARVTIFGASGARSLDNLITVARQAKLTNGNLNGSRTGVAVNYRSMIAGLTGLIGGVGGTASAGAGTGAVVGLAAGATARFAQNQADGLSARALMSPDVTKWLASAPRTFNQAAVNRHIGELGQIAARNPGFAREVEALQQRIMEAANDNAGGMSRAAASNDPSQREDQ